MKPPMIRYPGGKARLAKWIMSHVPKTGRFRYVEPFAGRGNVYFHVRCDSQLSRRFSSYWLNDLSTWKFFRVLQVIDPKEIPIVCGDLSISKEELSLFVQSETLRNSPRGILIEPYVTYSGMGYNGSRASPDHPRLKGKISYLRDLQLSASILRTNTEVTCQDAIPLIRSLRKTDFAYIDPPYPGCDPGAYEVGPISWHEEIVESILSSSCRCLVSNYDVYPYNRLGTPVKKVVPLYMSDAALGDVRTECLWIR